MSLNKIKQLAESLTKVAEGRKELFVPNLLTKLAQCSEAYPHDQTIGQISVVLSKMAANKTQFITKNELTSLYNKLHSRNTKFAELFKQELGGLTVELATPKLYERDEATYEVTPYQSSDHILSNALANAFDKTISVKSYSEILGKKAVASVNYALDSINLKASHCDVVDGSAKFIIVKADYETPKGITSFYVPVEISDGKVCEANCFMGNSAPQDLVHGAVKSYILASAGTKLKVSGSVILSALTKAASEDRPLSDAELALTRLRATREAAAGTGIVGQMVAKASVEDVQLPKSDEFASIEKLFNSPTGVAGFEFGVDKVTTARDAIVRELVSFGHKNPQVVVASCEKSTIYYGVSLFGGNLAFTVPVKLADGKLLKPSVLICNGSISAFNRDSISSLQSSNNTDNKVAATASVYAGFKPSDLVNNIRVALAEGNHDRAEDALNVLAQGKDEKAYASGFAVYMEGLAGKKVEASTKCAKLVTSSTSEHKICSHTGLPSHKVYQDKHGNCQPLYRRGMSETYEGASFMNAKIFG